VRSKGRRLLTPTDREAIRTAQVACDAASSRTDPQLFYQAHIRFHEAISCQRERIPPDLNDRLMPSWSLTGGRSPIIPA
jgi:hypothetical protein